MTSYQRKTNLKEVVYHYSRAKRASAEVISGIQRISKTCLTLPDPVYFIIDQCARVGYNPTNQKIILDHGYHVTWAYNEVDHK